MAEIRNSGYIVGDYTPICQIENALLKGSGGTWENPEADEHSNSSAPFEDIGKFFRDTDADYITPETFLT